jgi:hypothetical protein
MTNTVEIKVLPADKITPAPLPAGGRLLGLTPGGQPLTVTREQLDQQAEDAAVAAVGALVDGEAAERVAADTALAGQIAGRTTPEQAAAAAPVQSVAGRQGAVTLTGADVTHARAATGAVSLPIADLLNDLWWVRGFGVSTASADNRGALRNALIAANGTVVNIPAGTYRIAPDPGSATILNIPAGTTLRGAGARTVLRFELTDATLRQCFVVAGPDVTIENLAIEVVGPGGGIVHTCTIFQYSSSNLTLRRLTVNGNVVESGGAASGTVHFLTFSTAADTSDLLVEECDIRRCSFLFLKTNGNTRATRRVKMRGGRVREMFGTCSINSPSGVCNDVEYEGVSYDTPLAIDPAFRFFNGGASNKNLRISSTHYSGNVYDCIHIEEATERLSISNITSEAVPVLDGAIIKIIDNDEGGSFVTPRQITVVGANLAPATPGRAAGDGVSLTWDLEGNASGLMVTMSDITARRFATGFEFDVAPRTGLMLSNLIADDCGEGFFFLRGSPSTKLKALNCTTGLVVQRGGVFGELTVSGNGTDFLAVEQAFTILRWNDMLPNAALEGGGATTDLVVMPLTKVRANGTLIAHLTPQFGSDASMRVYDFDWDGSAATLTSRRALTGAAAISLVVVGTDLVLRCVVPGTGVTADATVSFSGAWTVIP